MHACMQACANGNDHDDAVCVQLWLYALVYVFVCTPVCIMYVCMCPHVCVCMHVCVYVCLYVWVQECVHAFPYLCMLVFNNVLWYRMA